MFSIFADDIVWAEVPIVAWLVVSLVIVLATVWRSGWDGAQRRLSRRRVLWGVSLAVAVCASVALHAVSGQPIPLYL